MTITKFQALALLVSSLGCAAFGLFLMVGYFTVPAEGRLDPVAAALLTTMLFTACGIGLDTFVSADLE
ncbi:hypothetical protein [Deinococcus aluminii]|uniref:Uncharacterized protein n=1 Tax=Deinococcus aluminii TaxID=1656885 RepID=A0ABP9XEW2_9DEIO